MTSNNQPHHLKPFQQSGNSLYWLLAALVFLVMVLALFRPVVAYDIWWHMVLGQIIQDTGQLVSDHSLFSWTEIVNQGAYNVWLADVALNLVHKQWGNLGLVALRYLVFTFIFLLMVHYALRRNVAAHPLTWLVILLGVMYAWPTALVKPELFTIAFLGLSVWLYFVIRSSDRDRWYLPYLYPLIILLWQNFHGAFGLIAVFFICILIGEGLNILFSPSVAMPRARSRHLFYALLLCVPVLFINPLGYKLPAHFLALLFDEGVKPDVRTMGFWPTYVFNSAPYYVLDYLVLSMSIFVLLVWQRLKTRETDWVVILVFLAFSAMYIKYARMILLFSPISVYVCLDLLAYKKQSWLWPDRPAGKWLIGVVSIALIAGISWRSWNNRACDIEWSLSYLEETRSQPIAETRFIKANLPGRKVGNLSRDGGYLIYELWPEKRVTVDTRNFPWLGSNWLEEYFAFQAGRNIGEFLANNPADFWLVNYQYPQVFEWFMKSDAWTPVFFGPVGTIFVPGGKSTGEPIIAPEVAEMRDFENILVAINAALNVEDLSFARQLQIAAQKNRKSSCSEAENLGSDMAEIINGFQAYYAGNYEQALEILDKKRSVLNTESQVIRIIEHLAIQDWKDQDYAGAWHWTKRLLEHPMHASSVYDHMVTDWQMAHMPGDAGYVPDPDANWEKFADFIIKNEDRIDVNYRFIAGVARAMKEGTYEGGAELAIRYPGENGDVTP